MEACLLGEGHGLDFLVRFVTRPIAQDCVPRVGSAKGHYCKVFVKDRFGRNVTTCDEGRSISAKSRNKKVSKQPDFPLAAPISPVNRGFFGVSLRHKSFEAHLSVLYVVPREDKPSYTLTGRYGVRNAIMLQENNE